MVGGGLVTSECEQILREFHRFDSEDARAAFADKWIRITARQMDVTWTVFYELLRIIRDRRLYENTSYMADKKSRLSFEEYWDQVVQKPFETWAELEKVYHFVSENAPELLGGTFDDATKFTRGQLAAQGTTGNTRPEGRPKNNANCTVNSLDERAKENDVSRRTQIKLDHLARDFPAHHERVKAGELSVHAACVEAGIAKRTVPLPLDPPGAARAILKHFRDDSLLEVVRILARHAGLDLLRDGELVD